MLLLLLACQPAHTDPLFVEAAPKEEPAAQPPAGPVDPPAAAAPAPIVINEVCPDNDSLYQEASGQTPDWVELYHRGEAPQSIDGWTLADADGAPLLALSGTLNPGERRLLALPAPLDAAAGRLRLLDADGQGQDAIAWANRPSDAVVGRFPDGSAYVADSVYGTPNGPNPWEPGAETDPAAALFDPTRILTVDLSLDAAAIAALNADPYAEVAGAVGIGGAWFSPVGINLKGQWGSLRSLSQKAGFKVDLDAYVDGQEVRGLDKLTFNSMVQDPSFVHEQLAYTLFRDLDVPTPRVGYVWLRLNGEDRGLYLHVETPDDRFLARWFGDGEGNLYEGQYGQDLTDGSYTTLDLDQDGDHGVAPYVDLALIAELLNTPPDESQVAALEALVDVDRVLQAFAVEALIGHWDGYLYYPNNFRWYIDPLTQRATYLPWGADQTFDWDADPYDASGALARWMFQVPSLRRRYDLLLWETAERMAALDLDAQALDDWALIAEAVEADPYKEVSTADAETWVNSTVDFIRWRPDDALTELFPDGAP